MTRRHFDPSAFLPLSPAMFHVLVALADGEKHGYAILKEVSRNTDGRVRLGPGTLYAVIRRFVDAELIAESDERPDPALDDERRRYYRLLDAGRQVVRAELARMEQAIALARDKRLVARHV
jgi:DNA-binding PadR family transcriptional regulator